MNNSEINHAIATQINGWIYDEGIFYHDVNGNTCYLADYCNSVPHALDLAKAGNIGIQPIETGWSAYAVANPELTAVNDLPGKAICLCLLAIVDSKAI